MTEQEWRAELSAILSGTEWRLSRCGVSLEGGTCSARVVHVNGEERAILMQCDQFTTAASRTGEVTRQLRFVKEA